jgi:hypothetical protein
VAAAREEKYAAVRTPRAALPGATRAHYEVETVTIEITPDERLLNCDNSRLGLRPREPDLARGTDRPEGNR